MTSSTALGTVSSSTYKYPESKSKSLEDVPKIGEEIRKNAEMKTLQSTTVTVI